MASLILQLINENNINYPEIHYCEYLNYHFDFQYSYFQLLLCCRWLEHNCTCLLNSNSDYDLEYDYWNCYADDYGDYDGCGCDDGGVAVAVAVVGVVVCSRCLSCAMEAIQYNHVLISH